MESAFERQEALRLAAENRKNRVKLGLPPEEAVDAALPDDTKTIAVTIDNSCVREYLKKTRDLANQVAEYEKTSSEKMALFESELQNVLYAVKELVDNFNLYVAEERRDRAAHRERVAKTCDKIDRELSY